MDVWHSAQPDVTEKRSGWLGRYLDLDAIENKNSFSGVALNNQLPLALSSTKHVASLVVSEDNRVLPTLQALYQNYDFLVPTKFIFDVTALRASNYSQSKLAQNLQIIAQ